MRFALLWVLCVAEIWHAKRLKISQLKQTNDNNQHTTIDAESTRTIAFVNEWKYCIRKKNILLATIQCGSNGTSDNRMSLILCTYQSMQAIVSNFLIVFLTQNSIDGEANFHVRSTEPERHSWWEFFDFYSNQSIKSIDMQEMHPKECQLPFLTVETFRNHWLNSK